VTTSPDRRAGSLDSRWRQALETAPEVYVALDGDGRIADWNRAAAGSVRVQRQDVLGSPMTRFVPEQDREQAQLDLLATLRRPRDGQHDPVHLDLLTETGREFSAECLVWGVDRRGGILAHCFVRDVTERRRAQQTAALLAAVVEGSADAIITEGRTAGSRRGTPPPSRCTAGPGGGGGLPSYIIVPLDKVPEHTT
jgi:PAS domain S-box-containing protein